MEGRRWARGLLQGAGGGDGEQLRKGCAPAVSSEVTDEFMVAGWTYLSLRTTVLRFESRSWATCMILL